MEYALELKDLKKTYPGTQALKGINLKVKNNSFLALLGKNGAGKSTMIGILSYLIKKTSGSASVMGLDLLKNETQIKSLLGIVPQEINLHPYDTLIDLLINQAGYHGIDRKTARIRAKEYLKILRLSDKQNAPLLSLSGGMKRRAMIARAIIHDPEIILLDEPTAGVDVEVRAIIWDFLRKLQKQGKTIILTTHYLEEAEALCDTIAVIRSGKITHQGSMSETLAKSSDASLIVDVESHKLSKKDFGELKSEVQIMNDGRLEFSTKKYSVNEILTKIIKSGLNITNIRKSRSNLEDYL